MNSEDLKRNQSEINLDLVKNMIQKKDPVFFNKMLISSNENVKRTDFYFLNYSTEIFNREILEVTFPMYGMIKDNFEEFLGGVIKHGDKKDFNSESILNSLSTQYGIDPKKDIHSTAEDFIWPLKVENSNVRSNQPLYFIPNRTISYKCESCSGAKYITCEDNTCHGRHEWPCTTCNQKGIVTCHTCNGQKKLNCNQCNGSNKVKCRNCGGDGRVNDGMGAKMARGTQSGRQKDKFFQEQRCGKCSGNGLVACSNCNNGNVVCHTCTGQGTLVCNTCSGDRTIICGQCYGDKERYGKIDCHTCKAMGEMGKLTFGKTTISNQSVSKIFFDKSNIEDIDPTSLMKHANLHTAQEVISRIYNEINEVNYPELVNSYIKNIHQELSLSSSGNTNKITREELYYQLIPCVQIEFRHMITNKLHFATILNVFDNPEIIIDKSSEQIKSDTSDKFKSLGNTFSKLFKTKKFKAKEDLKREIKLMIMIAKVDGKIEDEEKIFLSSEISNLNLFTVNEKMEFFNLMDSETLPELTKQDVVFYDQLKFDETIKKLKSLAGKDGQVEEKEQTFIDELIQKNTEFRIKK
jgi:hypothetical protein